MQLTAKARLAHRQDARGFTLLEVLIAALLLIVALVGSIALVIGISRGNQTTRARDNAFFLAQQSLDQLSAIPLAQLPTSNFFNSSTPVCYAEGEDSFTDHPLPAANCTGLPSAPAAAAPSAYYVRSQVCCYGTAFSVAAGGPAVQLPAGCTNPPLIAGVAGSVNSYGSNGGSCTIQVEVTWPAEPLPAVATAADLFATNPPTASTLTYQNHIVETMVRSQ